MTDTSTRVVGVDGLRAFAVLGVVIYHALAWEHVRTGVPLAAAANVGARGVDLFFVISGFCLAFPHVVMKTNVRTVSIDLRAFLMRRFTRIAPSYYVALGIFGILACSSFGLPADLPGAIHAIPPLAEFVADAAFAPSPNSVFNSVFWTLGVEMRWYFAFPLLMMLYARSRALFTMVGLCGYAAFALGVPFEDLAMLPCFMLGVIAVDVVRNIQNERVFIGAAAAASSMLAIGTIAQYVIGGAYNHADPFWHLASFFVVVGAASKPVVRVLSWRPLIEVGRASFSIYLVHLPTIAFLVRHHVPWYAAGLGGVGAGFIFYHIVERSLLREDRRLAIESYLKRFNPARTLRIKNVETG